MKKKIRMVQHYRPYMPGDEPMLPKHIADELIADGFAIDLTAKAEPKATESAPEPRKQAAVEASDEPPAASEPPMVTADASAPAVSLDETTETKPKKVTKK